MKRLNIVIPCGGKGQRLTEAGFYGTKPFIDILGKQMIDRVIDHLNITNRDLHFILVPNIANKDDAKRFEDVPNTTVIYEETRQGQLGGVMQARDYINNDTELLIVNSDQIIDLDFIAMFNFIDKHEPDGLIVTMYGTGTQSSYVRIAPDYTIAEVREKHQISTDATAGYYYFSSGKQFVECADKMIYANERVNNEFYIAPVYNYLIRDSKCILHYPISPLNFYNLGLPTPLKAYIKMLKRCANG